MVFHVEHNIVFLFARSITNHVKLLKYEYWTCVVWYLMEEKEITLGNTAICPNKKSF